MWRMWTAARRLGALRCGGREARRRLLAGPAHAGAAEAQRLPGVGAGAGRARQRGGAGAGASGGARAARRRSAGRSWRRPPTAPAMSRPPARRMCWPTCAGASTWCSTAALARSGLKSTIVACLGEPTLLRPGGVARAEIERVLGRPLAVAAGAGDAARARHAGLALRAEGAAAPGGASAARRARPCSPSGPTCRRPTAWRSISRRAAI